MKRWILAILLLFAANTVVFADGAQWVSGKIKNLNPIKQMILLTPQNAISDDSIIAITVDENTTYTDVESYNRLKAGQKVEIEIYDDETTPKKLAREVKLINPPAIHPEEVKS